MKIGCHCGATIHDNTDDLPHKGHLVPDQAWFTKFDAIDDQIIAPVADGRMNKETAYHLMRNIISNATRLMWQCSACGRLYVDDLNHELRCFVPEGEPRGLGILPGPARTLRGMGGLGDSRV